MSYLALAVLLLLWLGLFLPGLLQAHRSSPFVSATSFQQSLTRISTGMAARRSPGGHAPAQAWRTRRPRRPSRTVARRRDTLMALSATVIGATAIGLSFGGLFLLLIVPPLLALAGYIVMLRIQVGQRRALARPIAAASAPATVVTSPVAAPDDDGIVPSVGRRVALIATDDDVELERLAG